MMRYSTRVVVFEQSRRGCRGGVAGCICLSCDLLSIQMATAEVYAEDKILVSR